MDMNELNTSLQNMVNISSSKGEEKDESSQPLKKTKTVKPKVSQPKIIKKTLKYRIRKPVDRPTKISSKRYGKTYGVCQSKTFSNVNGVIADDLHSKGFPDFNDTAHLLPVVEILEKYNFKYEIRPDINKQHEDFFLQDKYMNTFFKHYPEYICVDLLCEIIELELNLYLFISVDANGHCEIVSIGLFKSCEAGLAWFCEVFRKHNPNWRKIKLITTDRKARNSDNLKTEFPEKLILISFFHSMKSIKEDLSNLECSLTDDETNKVLQIFEQMIFASDEETYAELLKQLKSMPSAVSTYFRKSWHQKKDSWALSQHLISKVFLKSFNSYLNVIRKTIRPFITALDSLENVIKILCRSIEKMRLERFKNLTNVFQNSTEKQSAACKYSQILTSHAVELLAEQISCSADVKNLKKLACGKYAYSEDIVTVNTCSCNFFQLFFLPCSHIFSTRRHLSLPYYSESLCSTRWFASNYNKIFLEMHSIFSLSFQTSGVGNFMSPNNYQKCFKIASDLWPLLVSCPDSVSQNRILILKNLFRAWEHDIKINIKSSDSTKNPSSSVNDQREAPGDYWKDVYGISLKDILDSDNDILSLPLNL